MTAVTVWVVLTLGGAPTLDVGGAIGVTAPVSAVTGRQGIALPHVALTDPGVPVALVRHEMMHQAQWDALGPGFALAYAAGLGYGFEYYLGDGHEWIPPPDLAYSCPLARVDDAGLSFAPCWRWLWHSK